MFYIGFVSGVVVAIILFTLGLFFAHLLLNTNEKPIIEGKIFNPVSKKGKRPPLVQDDEKAYRKELKERGE